MDVADAVEQCERLFAWTLESIAPDDRSEPAPCVYPSHFFE
jgi:hypothetical protein